MKKAFVLVLGIIILVGAVLAEQIEKWWEGKMVTVTYNRFQDKTTLGLDTENVEVALGWSLEMRTKPCLTSMIKFKGKIPKDSSPLVRMNFFSFSSGSWKFLSNHGLYALVDSKPMKMPKTDHQGSVGIDGGVSEIISFWLSWDEFCKLCDAKIVEFQLGSEEFKAEEPEFAFWRQFRQTYLDLLEEK